MASESEMQSLPPISSLKDQTGAAVTASVPPPPPPIEPPVTTSVVDAHNVAAVTQNNGGINGINGVNGTQSPQPPAVAAAAAAAVPRSEEESAVAKLPALSQEQPPLPIHSTITGESDTVMRSPSPPPETAPAAPQPQSQPPASEVQLQTKEPASAPLVSDTTAPLLPPEPEPPVTAAPATETPPLTEKPRATELPPTPIASDPVIQPPTSDLRESAQPTTTEQADQIREEKEKEALQADTEMANGLLQDKSVPIGRTLTPEAKPSEGDPMDISEPAAPEVPVAPEAMATESKPAAHEPAVTVPAPEPESTRPEPAVAAPAPSLTIVTTEEVPKTSELEKKLEPEAQAKQEGPPKDVIPAPAPSQDKLSVEEDHVMLDRPASPSKLARSREDESAEDEPATKRVKSATEESTAPEFKVPETPVSSVQPRHPSQPAEEKRPASSGTGTQTKELLPAPPERAKDPSHNESITPLQHKHLLRGLTNLKKGPHAAAYNQPVDPVALGLPTYYDYVKEPMDLKTMEQKLRNEQYTSTAAYVADFDLMVANSVTFNGPEHLITQHAFHMRNSFDKHLANLPSHEATEPTAAEKKAKKASAPKPAAPRRESRSSVGGGGSAKSPSASSPTQTFALGPQGIPLIRRDSMAADGRPRREIHPPAPKDLPYSTQKPKRKKFQWELKFCQEVVNEMNKPKHATVSWPFAQPVDPVAMNIPSYHKIIKKPMDMSTIDAKLKSGQYENAREFDADVKLMFNNCYKFNPADHAVHKAGKQYEAIYDEKWSTKKQWISDHAPASSSGAQSPGSNSESEVGAAGGGGGDSESEPEEESSSEEEDESKEIKSIKEQIAKMQKKVDAMQKKKGSPPVAPSRKLKSGGGSGGGSGSKSKKDGGKKGGSDKKEKSGKSSGGGGGGSKSKGEKSKKIPYVTYEQKQDISNRINTLPENRMTTALEIIRNNMPNLKGVNEDEIELDIDELSNEVLYKLLVFIRKYSPTDDAGGHSGGGHGSGGHHGSSSGGGGSHHKSKSSSQPVASSRPKKNKPMSKTEQEAKIKELQGKLSGLKSGSAAAASTATAGGNAGRATAESPGGYSSHAQVEEDTSGDDEDSEESEED